MFIVDSTPSCQDNSTTPSPSSGQQARDTSLVLVLVVRLFDQPLQDPSAIRSGIEQVSDGPMMERYGVAPTRHMR